MLPLGNHILLRGDTEASPPLVPDTRNGSRFGLIQPEYRQRPTNKARVNDLLYFLDPPRLAFCAGPGEETRPPGPDRAEESPPGSEDLAPVRHDRDGAGELASAVRCPAAQKHTAARCGGRISSCYSAPPLLLPNPWAQSSPPRNAAGPWGRGATSAGSSSS
jgi:hypothetical protein